MSEGPKTPRTKSVEPSSDGTLSANGSPEERSKILMAKSGAEVGPFTVERHLCTASALLRKVQLPHCTFSVLSTWGRQKCC